MTTNIILLLLLTIGNMWTMSRLKNPLHKVHLVLLSFSLFRNSFLGKEKRKQLTYLYWFYFLYSVSWTCSFLRHWNCKYFPICRATVFRGWKPYDVSRASFDVHKHSARARIQYQNASTNQLATWWSRELQKCCFEVLPRWTTSVEKSKLWNWRKN